MIFLSITVITGHGGPDLALPGDVRGHRRVRDGAARRRCSASTVLPTLVIGALVAAAVGALLAIPVLRLGGIYLSLGTLAFALMFETRDRAARLGEWRGPAGAGPTPGDRPFDRRPTSFFLLCVVLLVVASIFVILVRRGTTGQFLDALRGSETAAQSIGINPTRIRDPRVRAVGRDRRARRRPARDAEAHRAPRPTSATSSASFFVVVVVTLVAADRRGRDQRRARRSC